MERLAFNFYRSYYEIALELPEDDRLVFLMAIFEMQFNGNEPTDLKGMAKFAFKSQRHSLIKQLEGYKSGKNGGRPPKGTQKGNHKGIETIPPKGTPNQEKGEEKGEVQEKEKEKDKVEVELEKCKIIALKDDKWKRLAKTNETELDAFNDHLILIGTDKKIPIDYKRHFVNWKKQKPEILNKFNNQNRDDSW
jgi:phage terminase small subunit